MLLGYSYTAVFLTAIASYIGYSLYCLIRNIGIARRTNLPVVVIPINQHFIGWVVLSVPLRWWIKSKLPAMAWKRIRLTIYGWEWFERTQPFEEYGSAASAHDSFVIAGFSHTELWTRSPEIAHEVLKRPQDFEQLELASLVMNKFGDNVLTTNGKVWSRHRKAIASVINERISRTVWDASIRQTSGLLEDVFSTYSADAGATAATNQFPDMLKQITINVLSSAGMGVDKDWKEGARVEGSGAGISASFIRATKTVMHGVTGALVLPTWFMQSYPAFMPGYSFMSSLSAAIAAFSAHTQAMISAERRRLAAEPGDARHNILSQMIQGASNTSKGAALSDSDMQGNLFVFTAAGFDSTSNTLAYAFVMLARYPAWQAWLQEEADALLADDARDYTAIFPRATRTLAFLLEVLRFFPALVHITKQTAHAVRIDTSAGAHFFPKKTTVFLHLVGLHTNPAVWRGLNPSDEVATKDQAPVVSSGTEGKDGDEMVFRPTRWLNPAGAASPMFQPPPGTYLAWSTGPRVCPGQRMAQVEFVAILLTLLRASSVEAVQGSLAEREAALDAHIKDSMSVLTLQMMNVFDVDPADDTKGLRLRLRRR